MTDDQTTRWELRYRMEKAHEALIVNVNQFVEAFHAAAVKAREALKRDAIAFNERLAAAQREAEAKRAADEAAYQEWKRQREERA